MHCSSRRLSSPRIYVLLRTITSQNKTSRVFICSNCIYLETVEYSVINKNVGSKKVSDVKGG